MNGEKLVYKAPEWAGLPHHPMYIDVVREGVLVSQHKLMDADHFLIGRWFLIVEAMVACILGQNASAFSLDKSLPPFEMNSMYYDSSVPLGTAYIMDLKSQNGTFLGDVRLTPHEYVQLSNGNRLRFGSVHAKRSFLVRDEEGTDFSPDWMDRMSGKRSLEKSRAVFTKSGQLTQQAVAALSKTSEKNIHTSSVSDCLNDDDDDVTPLEENIRHYIDSETGLLDTKHLRHSPVFHRLSPVQIEIVQQIEHTLCQFKSKQGRNDQDEEDPEKEATCETNHVQSQVQILVDRLLQSARNGDANGENDNAAVTLSTFMKESLDDRLFDEDDEFFDRSRAWNQKNLNQTRQSSLAQEPAKHEMEPQPDLSLSNSSVDEDPLDIYMRENQIKLRREEHSSLSQTTVPLKPKSIHVDKSLREHVASSRAISQAVNVLSRINNTQHQEAMTQLKANQRHLLMTDSDAEKEEDVL